MRRVGIVDRAVSTLDRIEERNDQLADQAQATLAAWERAADIGNACCLVLTVVAALAVLYSLVSML